MAKVAGTSSTSRRCGGTKRNGKMACVSLFLVVLLAGNLVQEGSAQAAAPGANFDWMGLMTRLLENTVLGPFVTAINAVSGGVPNLNQAVLGLTGNIVNASRAQQASAQQAANGFSSSSPSSSGPAVFRRDAVDGSPVAPASAAVPAEGHQALKSNGQEQQQEVHHPHDLFNEVQLPQHHAARGAASAPCNSSASPASPVKLDKHSKDAAATDSASADLAARNANDSDDDDDSIEDHSDEDLSPDSSAPFGGDFALHAKDLPVNNASARAEPVDAAAAVDADADEATVRDAEEEEEDDEDADTYASASPVHARMVFKRSAPAVAVANAAQNASSAQHVARADPPATGATGFNGVNNAFVNGVQGANNIMADTALGLTQANAGGLLAAGNLAAGTIAAGNNILANAANAFNTLGIQQANALNNVATNGAGQLANNNAAAKSQLEAAKVAQLEAGKGAAEGQKLAAADAHQKVPEKAGSHGNEIPFPPAPMTTPKPVVYYTPSPKFYAVKPVYAGKGRPVGGKPC